MVELEECVVVEDAAGFRIAYFYFADREVVGTSRERMTRRQAVMMARAFAKVGAP